MVIFSNIKKCSEERYPELLERMLSHVQNTLVRDKDDIPCILCGTPTMNMAVLVPDERDNALGKAPEGKTRLVMFNICPEHDFNDGSIVHEVDRALIRHWQ